jgi:acyl-coenzyme A thioesterase PaaI-like protein
MKHELAAAARRLANEVRVSAAPSSVMAEAVALVEQAADLLAPHGFRGVLAQATLDGTDHPSMLAGRPETIFPYSPAIGPLNPLAPPAVFDPVGEPPHAHIEGIVTFPPVMVGAPGLAHGGAVALVLDELLGLVNVVNGQGAMTGTLTVRYRSPTPAGRPLTLFAELTGAERRKVFTRGEVRDGDLVTAEAEGVFIQVPFVAPPPTGA